MLGHYSLRPTAIFRTAKEVAEADRLHSELEKAGGEESDSDELDEEDDHREWEVTRTIKNESNGMEFEVKFGYSFSQGMHLLKLRLK